MNNSVVMFASLCLWVCLSTPSLVSLNTSVGEEKDLTFSETSLEVLYLYLKHFSVIAEKHFLVIADYHQKLMENRDAESSPWFFPLFAFGCSQMDIAEVESNSIRNVITIHPDVQVFS